MSSDGLYVPGGSVVHRLPGQVKIVAGVLFVAVAVATPVRAWPALVGYLVIALGVVAVARLPWRTVARRMVVETPVVVFAAVLPFVATGPAITLGPVSVSAPGVTGAALLLAKATLGVLTGVLLASTTTPRELLAALDRLRLPRQLVAITTFMVRYTGVVVADLARMRVARAARGFTGNGLAQLRIEAAGVGTLFVRTYERGERVHRAMLSRGYTGRLPATGATGAGATQWGRGLLAPALAAACLTIGLL